MRKHLMFVALFSVSDAAMAQSPATLYGTADAGVGKIKSDDGRNKVRMSSTKLINNNDTHLGFMGVEALGDGQ